MTDRNAMLQANYKPVTTQGEITGKAFVDWSRINEARYNANNSRGLLSSYPGGGNDDNLSLMPHELAFGKKEQGAQMRYMRAGEPNEHGLTALAGTRYGDYWTDEAMMRDYYFMGVVKTEYRVGENIDPNHGFSFVRAGSISTVNNGPGDIFAGDLICWRFPLTKRSPNDDGTRPITNEMGPIVHQNRQGTPNTKYLAEIMRFDYTDFSSQINGAFHAMQATINNPDPGISDMEFEEFFVSQGSSDARSISSLQEEAMAYKFGLLGCGLSMIETLIRKGLLKLGDGLREKPTEEQEKSAANDVRKLANKELKLWSKNIDEQELQMEILADMFLQDLNNGNPLRVAAQNRLWATHGDAANLRNFKEIMFFTGKKPETRFIKLRANLMKVLCSGIAGSWYSKCSRVIGKSMSSGKQSDTVHLMLSHFRPGM